MFVKAQIGKCGLCILLYFFFCIILLLAKRNFVLKEEINETTTTHLQDPTFHATIAGRIIKGGKMEINIPRRRNFQDETNVSQKSTVLLQQMSSVCAKYNLRTPPIQRHFLYSARHKSMYCWIRKVASTSFIKLFSDMNNRQLSSNFYKELDFLSLQSLQDLQRLASADAVFKLLVVRHPFQRLVSSYRDRIEDNSKYTAQAWLYVRQIFYLSRPQLFRSTVSTGNALQRIFLPNRKLKTIPSFREFLEWLLDQPPDRDDVHWARYYNHCAVCNVNYSFVLKLDDYNIQQVNYVLSKLQLDRYEISLPELQRTRDGVTNFNVTCKYFGSLTNDIVLRLYERYRVDFEMYNYRVDEYLRCVRQQ